MPPNNLQDAGRPPPRRIIEVKTSVARMLWNQVHFTKPVPGAEQTLVLLSQDTCDLMEPADANGHNKNIAKGKRNPMWESLLTVGEGAVTAPV